MDSVKAKGYMVDLIRRLMPIKRCLMGDEVRESLEVIKQELQDLVIHSVPSGTEIFDWIIPDEWKLHACSIVSENGELICSDKMNFLHVMGYSEPVDAKLTLDELKEHLFTIPEQPNAIPYVTSYYRKSWGFCLPYSVFNKLSAGTYSVKIDASFHKGSLNYGELLIKGRTDEEVLLSTYICHPNMANNELSGPAVAVALAQYLYNLPKLRYSYRIVFVPETIGALTFLKSRKVHLQKKVIAGFVLTCLGDNRVYSYLPSRRGDTLADRISRAVLKNDITDYVEYSWLDRGSDERQYCSPLIDLPVCSMMRSKYGSYPEYHTSLDNLGDVVTSEGLFGSFEIYKAAINLLEQNYKYISQIHGEPFLQKRSLFKNNSRQFATGQTRQLLNFVSLCDGKYDLIDILNIMQCTTTELLGIVETALENDLVKTV